MTKLLCVFAAILLLLSKIVDDLATALCTPWILLELSTEGSDSLVWQREDGTISAEINAISLSFGERRNYCTPNNVFGVRIAGMVNGKPLQQMDLDLPDDLIC